MQFLTMITNTYSYFTNYDNFHLCCLTAVMVRSKETLREIHDRVRSSTANSNNTDVFAEENEEEEDLEEAQGITYDQFEIIIGVIAQIGHRLGSQHLPAEIRMRYRDLCA